MIKSWIGQLTSWLLRTIKTRLIAVTLRRADVPHVSISSWKHECRRDKKKRGLIHFFATWQTAHTHTHTLARGLVHNIFVAEWWVVKCAMRRILLQLLHRYWSEKEDTQSKIDDNSRPLQRKIAYLYPYLNLHAYIHHWSQILLKKKGTQLPVLQLLKLDT